ncbi:MAG: 4-hydroxy-tetrahydrodipicolinate reductase [Myxococcota bacterium]
MIRALVNGAAGRMGRHVLEALAAADDMTLAAALEMPGHPRLGDEVAPGVRLGDDPAKACSQADVAIDFSLPAGTLALLDAAQGAGLPVVIATTGFDAAGLARIESATRAIAIARAPNFSLGVNVLLELVAEAARRLPDYEIEILELHHSGKRDAPSGTALRLAERAAQARDQKLGDLAMTRREGETGPRPHGAIGLQSLRAGDSVGEHTVFLAGPGERLELAHRALSRDNFASGALRAARWLVGRQPGLYSMRDVLSGSP